MTFSAVILAGGKSSRMGLDKARLEIGGQTLLARQIGLAREAGATEVFISGRVGVDYSGFGCRVLVDKFPDAGPLSGIECGLAASPTPLLLVLAVDMAAMSAEFLRRLASHCTATTGAIPRVSGEIEPLAAFYPKAGWRLLVGDDVRSLKLKTENRTRKAEIDLSLVTSSPAEESKRAGPEAGAPGARDFAEACVANGVAVFVDLPGSDAKFFANWNSPADLPCPN